MQMLETGEDGGWDRESNDNNDNKDKSSNESRGCNDEPDALARDRRGDNSRDDGDGASGGNGPASKAREDQTEFDTTFLVVDDDDRCNANEEEKDVSDLSAMS